MSPAEVVWVDCAITECPADVPVVINRMLFVIPIVIRVNLILLFIPPNTLMRLLMPRPIVDVFQTLLLLLQSGFECFLGFEDERVGMEVDLVLQLDREVVNGT